jgi:ketosteroid isomerase-like protein
VRDTGRAMSEESTTPDLVERIRIIFEAADRADFDSITPFYAPDAIWVGRLFDTEGVVAIRDLWTEYYTTFEEFRVTLEGVRDFGNGVVLAENHHRGRVRGSGTLIDQRAAFVYEFTNDLVVRVTEHDDRDEARAAAERLAEERG